jgi:hypothetical protein
MGAIKMRDLTVQSGNEYATVLAVPMDNQPLKVSKRVLVQVGTIVRTTGWQRTCRVQSGDGKETLRGERIVNTGTMPWRSWAPMSPSRCATQHQERDVARFQRHGRETISRQKHRRRIHRRLPRNAMHVVLHKSHSGEHREHSINTSTQSTTR